MKFSSYRGYLLLTLGTLALTGCAALPASGPTESQVLDGGQTPKNPMGFHIIPLDANSIQAFDIAAPSPMSVFADARAQGEDNGLIGVGDMLNIAIFEAGNSLFAPGSTASNTASAPAGPTGAVSNINLPPEGVDAQGYVSVPYAGRIQAAGVTPDQLAERIESALSGQSQNPQVIVTIAKNLSNTVIVSGDLKSPGRFPLTLANEQLLDMIAIAGGPAHDDQDESVELTRAGQSAKVPLSDLEGDATQNVYLLPGDHIQLSYDPRSFTVFGAAEKVDQITFAAPRLSLAEALARTGGPSNYQADPNGIFLFRFERPAVAARLGLPASGAKIPVIYQLDMMQPASYFVAQEFPMQDQDVLYIANAKTDKVSKFLGLISELVAPAATGASVSR